MNTESDLTLYQLEFEHHTNTEQFNVIRLNRKRREARKKKRMERERGN